MSYVRAVAGLPLSGVRQQIWKHRSFVAAPTEPYVCAGVAPATDQAMAGDVFRGLAEACALGRWLDRHPATKLLHAHSRVGHFAAALAARRRGVPVLLHLHKLCGHPGVYRFLARFCRGRLVFNSIRTAVWTGIDPRTATVLHPFIQWPRQPAPPAGTGRLVAAGALVPVKRLDVLIEAVRRLRSAGENLPLVIFGRSTQPPDAKHQRIIEKLAASVPRIEFRDHARNWCDELRSEDIFVHTADREAFGIVILEAFALGCRVLVPEGVFAPELGLTRSPTGLASFRGEAAGLAEAIQVMRAVKPDASAWWAERRALADGFTAGGAAPSLAELYTSASRQTRCAAVGQAQ